MAAAAKKRKSDKEDQDQGHSRKKLKKDLSEQEQSDTQTVHKTSSEQTPPDSQEVQKEFSGQEQSQSQKGKEDLPEQTQTDSQKPESSSSHKSKVASDKASNEEQTEECFRQAALGLRSLSGDIESGQSEGSNTETDSKRGVLLAEVKIKTEKVDTGYEDSSKAVVDSAATDNKIVADNVVAENKLVGEVTSKDNITLADSSMTDSKASSKDSESDVKSEPMEHSDNDSDDEDSDDADILLKIQKQCATIQSTGGSLSRPNSYVAEPVTDSSFQITQPQSQSAIEGSTSAKDKECQQLSNQWKIDCELTCIKTEPVEEPCVSMQPIKTEHIKKEGDGHRLAQFDCKQEQAVSMGRNRSAVMTSMSDQLSHPHMGSGYARTVSLSQENVDRLTAATALTAVGQPLVGQPPVAQQQLLLLPPSHSQTAVTPAAHTLIQLASSAPAQQFVLTSSPIPVQGASMHTHHTAHSCQPLMPAAAPPPHTQAYSQMHPQIQPHAVSQAQAMQMASSTSAVAGFLQDSDLQAEEAAAFEVLAEWSSMSSAHHQMSSATATMDDDNTNDSVYSSSSSCCSSIGDSSNNGDSSNSNNGAYDNKGYWPFGWCHRVKDNYF